jgi:hypothetical protein
MLRNIAAGLLATALIAGPAFAQTSNSSATPNAAPSATVQTKTPAAAPANTMTAPATTNAKQAANPSKTVKHAKLHKKTVKHVASRSHVKSGKMHQARHVKPVKSHQAKSQLKTGTTAKRS